MKGQSPFIECNLLRDVFFTLVDLRREVSHSPKDGGRSSRTQPVLNSPKSIGYCVRVLFMETSITLFFTRAILTSPFLLVEELPRQQPLIERHLHNWGGTGGKYYYECYRDGRGVKCESRLGTSQKVRHLHPSRCRFWTSSLPWCTDGV